MLAALSAVLLVACGADVNTQLDLQRDYSGTRLFVLTMDERDVQSLTGGIEAAETALATHIPHELHFEGIQSEEDGYSATFTMSFADLDEYETKLQALLAHSDVPDEDQNLRVDFTSHPLHTSLEIKEEFYNDDIMGWAAKALYQEDIVSDEVNVLTASGTAVVTFDGEQVDSSTSLPRVHFSMVDDQRFAEIGLDIEFLDNSDLRLHVQYVVSSAAAPAQNDFISQVVDELSSSDLPISDVADSGVVSLDDASSEERTVSATFSTDEAATFGLQQFLDNDEATLQLVEVTDGSSPDVVTQYIGTHWSCDSICDPKNLQQLDGETLYPEQWSATQQRRGDGEFFIEFNQGMPLDAMASTTSLDLTGQVTQTFEFVVDNATIDGHEESVAERFEPQTHHGSFSTSVQGNKTVYTVMFEAANTTRLTEILNEYFAQKQVSDTAVIAHEPLSGVWASYDLEIDLSPLWHLAAGGVEDEALFEVQLPPLHGGSTDPSIDRERMIVLENSTGVFTVTASGPTVTTWWVAGIALLLVAVLLVLLFRTRKASRRVWSVPAGDIAQSKPYNVQGPNDHLTETEIFQAPIAPSGQVGSSADTRRIQSAHDTKALEQDQPFPDVPLPQDPPGRDVQDSDS